MVVSDHDANHDDATVAIVVASSATAPEDTEKGAVAAAILCGDVERVSVFLRRLLPEGAKRGGAERRCMKRALAVLDSEWKTREDAKRKATFASADTVMTDAVLMGGVYLPSESFAAVVEYIDHKTAVRSTPCCRAWWRTMSTLPPASHVNTCMHGGMGWQDLVNQLKTIRASNPRRVISRVTLGYKIKIGSLGNLSSASGGLLTHLDLTYAKGAKHLDFEVMAKQLLNLKGLAIEETFYRHEYAVGWLRGLANLVRAVSLESLRLNVHEFSCWPNDDAGSRAKWRGEYVSKITDDFLEDLANRRRPLAGMFLCGASDMLNFMGASAIGGSDARGADGLCHNGEGSTAGAGDSGKGGDGRANTSNLPEPPPSTLRKLWLSAPLDGPNITNSMAALGSGMSRLEELVVDRLKVTGEGWKQFATARIEANAENSAREGSSAAPRSSAGRDGGGRSRANTSTTAKPKTPSVLRRIRIQANGPDFVPSAATRSLLEDTVSESVTLYVGSWYKPVATQGVDATATGSEILGSGSGGGGNGACIATVDCEGAILELDEDVDFGAATAKTGVGAGTGGAAVPAGEESGKPGGSYGARSGVGVGARKKIRVLYNPWRLTSHELDAGYL